MPVSSGLAGELAPGAVIERAAERLGAQLEGLVLFGSAARGEMWEHSDVDLLVVLRPDVPVTRQLYSTWDAEIAPAASPLGRRISPHFVALPRDVREAGGLWFEVALDGLILQDPQLRVARMLSLLRQQMVAGAVSRRFVHGAEDYIRRARKRLAALEALYREQAWADVVRESQEVVELALKALIRRCRIEAPRLHDVSDVLSDASAALSDALAKELERLCEISRRLRRDRELAFYGSEDLTPSEFYREKDARQARDDAQWVVQTVEEEFRRG